MPSEKARFSKRRVLETGKSVFIAALVILALLLGAETGLYSGGLGTGELFERLGALISFGGGDFPEGNGAERTVFPEAARPMAMAVTFEDGSRYGVKYSAEVYAAYERFKPVLRGALGSAFDAEEITGSEWELALGRRGVYFDFLFEQSLPMLLEWLGGGERPGGIAERSARRLLISEVEGGLYLYYADERDGRFYRAATALGSFQLEPILPEFSPNRAAFGYEDARYEGTGPYFLYVGEMPEIQDFEVRTMPKNVMDEIFPVFGMNRYVAGRVPLVNSGEGYIENDSYLEIYPSGLIRFSGGIYTGAGVPENITAMEAAARAREIASECLKPAEGRDWLNLRSIDYAPESLEYTITFVYILAGTPVIYADSDSAAEIKIRGGEVVRATIYAREYIPMSEREERLLPERQAAAIAAQRDGGEPRLIYTDTGTAARAAWY